MACHDKALPKRRSENTLRMLIYIKNTLLLGLILSRYAAVIRDIFEQKWFSAANKFCV